MTDRAEIVKLFCDECVWVRAIRTHFQELFESGSARHQLLAESANQFFHDLNVVLVEYILLQQCKLTDPPYSGRDKKVPNLTADYLLTLSWTDATRASLVAANHRLQQFRCKVKKARNKLVAHADLRSRLNYLPMGEFSQTEEIDFWAALQEFVDVAHSEAIGGPYPIDAAMPDGDTLSLLHQLRDAIDYGDAIKQESGFLLRRLPLRRYRDA
jgi:hypothetical protein